MGLAINYKPISASHARKEISLLAREVGRMRV
jgi:hypothetical protein